MTASGHAPVRHMPITPIRWFGCSSVIVSTMGQTSSNAGEVAPAQKVRQRKLKPTFIALRRTADRLGSLTAPNRTGMYTVKGPASARRAANDKQAGDTPPTSCKSKTGAACSLGRFVWGVTTTSFSLPTFVRTVNAPVYGVPGLRQCTVAQPGKTSSAHKANNVIRRSFRAAAARRALTKHLPMAILLCTTFPGAYERTLTPLKHLNQCNYQIAIARSGGNHGYELYPPLYAGLSVRAVLQDAKVQHHGMMVTDLM